MPTKAEMYAQMADQVARQLTGSWQEWVGFLTTAARLYKYPFHEQLMIYAQRPDATACAEYDLWNNRMGRYVRRGSKGIALVMIPGTGPGCGMCLIFPTLAPAHIPAPLAVDAERGTHRTGHGDAGTQLRCARRRPGPAAGRCGRQAGGGILG